MNYCTGDQTPSTTQPSVYNLPDILPTISGQSSLERGASVQLYERLSVEMKDELVHYSDVSNTLADCIEQ